MEPIVPADPIDTRPSPPPLYLTAAIEDLPEERRDWQSGIATYAIGLFLWIVFLDQLAVRTLPIGGLGWSFAGAAAGGLIAYLLLYYGPAMLGLKTRRPLIVVASGTFGVAGAAWVPGLLMAGAQVAWFAVGTWYATDLVFRGLILLGMLDPLALEPVQLAGYWFPSGVFLASSLVWMVLIALLGATFLRLVLAINQVFPIFPALMLGGVMLAVVSGVPAFDPPRVDPATGRTVLRSGGLVAFAAMVQLICGFFATAGAIMVDWGAATRTERDVRWGGLVGVVLAPAILGSLALLTVAGAIGKASAPPPPPAPFAAPDPLGREYVRPGDRAIGSIESAAPAASTIRPTRARYTVRLAIQETAGSLLGGVILMTIGLSTMGPAAYAAYLYAQQLKALGPGLSRVRWKLVGIGFAWLMILAGWADKLELIFGVMGGLFGSLIGALAADAARQRRGWPGPRAGYNWPGLSAWALGAAAGIAPVAAGAVLGWTPWPWTILAFGVAFAARLVLTPLMGEPDPIGPDSLPPVAPG